MRVSDFLSVLAVAALAATPAAAVDLTKIDRAIAKEPAYKSKPKYCLLVFGPQAKFRAWLVLDGDVLYVDRNGNGDLTEKGEQCRAKEPQDEISRKDGYKPSDGYREWKVGDIVESDGKTKHTDLMVAISNNGCSLRVHTNGKRPEYVVKGNGPLQFADRPQDAPIVHFAGPLGIFLRKAALTPGQPGYVWAALGTPGLGKGTFAIIFDDELYRETELIGEVDFPAKEPGAERIKVKLTLRRY